jgi:hypothetical protein
MPRQDFSAVQVHAVAIKGIEASLLNRDSLLSDFPRRQEIAALAGDVFHPLSLYLEFCDYLEERLGVYAFLRLGRKMATAVMDASFPPGLKDVADATAHINIAHQWFCRPVVGAFEVAQHGTAGLSVRYTAPYNCILQEGLFYEVALRYGAPSASVQHVACRRKGADACLFEIKY